MHMLIFVKVLVSPIAHGISCNQLKTNITSISKIKPIPRLPISIRSYLNIPIFSAGEPSRSGDYWKK